MSNRFLWLFVIAVPLIFSAGWLSHPSLSPSQTTQTELVVKPTPSSLELQQQCAARADQFFKCQTGTPASDSDFSYQNHFNTSLQKCFVLMTPGIGAGSLENYFSEELYDAYEQKQYATYEWVPSPPKKFWEVPPIQCDVQDTPCTSQAEFDAAIKPFLEN